MTKHIDDFTPAEWDRAVKEANDLHNKELGKEPVDVMFASALRDLDAVIDLGGRKHGYQSWKDADNPSLVKRANHASMSRHLAEYFMGLDKDPESGMDPLLHIAFRAMAAYERKVRGIKDD